MNYIYTENIPFVECARTKYRAWFYTGRCGSNIIKKNIFDIYKKKTWMCETFLFIKTYSSWMLAMCGHHIRQRLGGRMQQKRSGDAILKGGIYFMRASFMYPYITNIRVYKIINFVNLKNSIMWNKRTCNANKPAPRSRVFVCVCVWAVHNSPFFGHIDTGSYIIHVWWKIAFMHIVHIV